MSEKQSFKQRIIAAAAGIDNGDPLKDFLTDDEIEYAVKLLSAIYLMADEDRVATEKRTVWVAYTNTDCNEGRGRDVAIATCETEETAIRLARKRYVQGSDGPVRPMSLVKLDGKWYVPSDAIHIVPATREDVANQAIREARLAAVEKAKAAGLTEEDLVVLMSDGRKTSR